MEWGLSSHVFSIITALLLLLLCLAWMVLRGSFRWPKRVDSGAWRHFLPFSTQGLQESPVRPQTTEEEGKGTTGQAEGAQLGQSRDGESGRAVGASIRHMLCDNLACAVCERSALEAQKVVRSRALNAWFPASWQPSLPTTSYVEHSRLPAVAALEDHDAVPQSAREPTPKGDDASRGPAAAPSPGRTEQPSSCGEPQGKKLLRFAQEAGPAAGLCEEGPGKPHRLAGCDGKGGGCDSGDCGSSSPSDSGATVANWAPDPSSSGQPESSDCSRKDLPTSGHHNGSRRNERDFSSQSQEGGSRASRLPAEQRSNPLRSSPKASPVSKAKPRFVPHGAHHSLRAGFPPGGTPFLADEVRETLEWHLALKRAQHGVGLPSLLLRSLRAFLPLAPGPTFQWPPRRDSVVVATRPGVLPFVSVATRRRLEQHVKKMVHLNRWGLPGRVQGALRHLRLGSPGAAEARKEEAGAKSQRTGNPDRYSLHVMTMAGGDPPALLTSSPDSRVKFQIHVAKKSFEVGQERFPRVVENSRGLAAPKERKQPLPKLTPRSCPLQRSGPSLFLRQKADGVEMNVKSKHIHFLWGLPTGYSESLRRMVPSAHAPPAAPPRAPSAVNFGHAAAVGFLTLCEQQRLDGHVLRKSVQHEWGLPRLAQRSLLQFLPLAPCRAPRRTATLHIHVKVEMLPGGSIPFIPLEAKRRLEEHVRSKVVERRWGLPKRVMESLRVFLAQPPPLPRDREGTPAPIRGQRIRQRSPPAEATTPPEWRNAECGQSAKHPALLRHVTQKALEIHLEWLSSSTSWPPHARKCSLPKAIRPGLERPQPRPRELFLVEPAVLGSLELNMIHKDLMRRWGLPTLYQKSLSCLFQVPHGLGASPPPPLPDRPSPGLDFPFPEALFIGQAPREELEWHVRRKHLQHLWGLPRLAQRSLRSLLPAVPLLPCQPSGHTEVSVLSAELFFLCRATIQALERNVQKRIIFQQWQLPKRVLRSLAMLHPEPQLGSGRHREAPALGTRGTKSGAQVFKRRVSAGPPKAPRVLSRLGARPREKLETHLAKKCLEGRLGPVLSGPPWRQTPSPWRRPLPRLILRGQKVLQARSSFCSSLCRGDLGRVEQAVQCSRVASLWGRGTRYAEAHRGLLPALPAQTARPRGAVSEFREVETTFLCEGERATLELHARKKKVQHEWRAPVLVRSSLQAFMGEAPKVPAQQKTNVQVCVIWQGELPFLPPRGRRGLELHVQKMNLQRSWGLPKRVLQSLRLLCPATREVSYAERGTQNPRRRAVPTPSYPQLRLMLQSSALEKMELHLDKKCMEAQLGVLPDLARLPQPCTLTSWRHLLPKSVPPGSRPLQARSPFLPFARTEDLDRIELAVQRKRLTSLWELGRSYAEAVGAMAPGPPLQPFTTRRPTLVFPAVQTPFLPDLEREELELHMRKRRIQHEWGLPGLLQMSLASFMAGSPSLKPLQKTLFQVETKPQELPFLPPDIRSCLEQHLQSLVHQRRWGLPQKILRFLKPLCQESGVGMLGGSAPNFHVSLPEGSCQTFPESLAEEEWDSTESLRMRASSRQRARLFDTYRSKILEKIHLHLVKKYVEIHSGIFPEVVRLSWQSVPASLGQPLLTLTPTGDPSPEPCSPFLPVAQGEELGQVGLVFLGRHWSPLCRLGRSYAEPAGPVTPGPPSQPLETRRPTLVSSPVQTPFLSYPEREDLELHVRKRRVQHEWGLPGVVQRSLAGFMGGAPSLSPLQRTLIQVQTTPQELLFLPTEACSCLEQHLQSLVRQRQWGLPQKVLRFVKPLCQESGLLGPLGQKAPSPPLSLPKRSGAEPASARRPRPPSQPLRCAGEADAGFSEGRAPFLQGRVREELELHVRKKKLQHEWGLPGLIQGSLSRFLHRAPPEPIPKKTTTGVRILLKEPLFLPQSSRNRLEFHVQQIKVQRQWRLPGRVLESLKHLCPDFGLLLPPPGRAAGPAEAFPCRPAAETVPAWSAAGGLYTEEGGQTEARRKRATPQLAQNLWKLEPKTVDEQQPHVTWKGRPGKPEALPAVANLSWRQGLPRVTSPGSTLGQPCSISFLLSAHSQEVYQTVKATWGSPLAPCDTDGVGGMVPQMPSEQPSPGRSGPAEFSEASTPFLLEQVREALEVHVVRKKIHHVWGFPVLVQKSLRAFMEELPLLAAHPKTNVLVCVLPQELPFLPGRISRHLELHVRKMNLQRQWGLPRRVLQSLRQLRPGLGGEAYRSTVSRSRPEQSGGVFPGGTGSQSPTVGKREGERRVIPERAQLLSTVGSAALKEMRLHLAKKDLEVQLGVLPPAAARSWPRASPPSGQALPKRIRSSQRTRQPRRDSLPFLRKEDTDRIELAVRRNHVATLWGLSVGYVEALAGMAPRPPPQFSRGQGADVVFLEVETPFLQEEDRDALEKHVKKKTIQHLWGTPRLVQRSLVAFVHMAPSLPTHKKSGTEVRPLLQELLFLPLGPRSHLERHIQGLKLQRQWGLPRRVLSSLKAFCPSPSVVRAPLSQGEEEEEQQTQRKKGFVNISPEQKSAMQVHLSKKYLEIHAEVPLKLTKSQQKTEGSGRGHLPRQIHAGQKRPPKGDTSLLFPPPNAADKLERSAEHQYPTSSWGLPGKDVEPQSRVALDGRVPALASRTAFVFQETEAPFLQEEEEQVLEDHIKKKRLQHQWGLPRAIAGSLQAFAPSPLRPPCPTRRAGQEIRIRVEQPFLLTALLWKDLEDSVKKMLIHQQWGLPKRIHRSLRALSPAVLTGSDHPSVQEKEGLPKSVGENIPTHAPGAEGALQASPPLQEVGVGTVPDGGAPEALPSSSTTAEHRGFSSIRKSKKTTMEMQDSAAHSPAQPASLGNVEEPRSVLSGQGPDPAQEARVTHTAPPAEEEEKRASGDTGQVPEGVKEERPQRVRRTSLDPKANNVATKGAPTEEQPLAIERQKILSDGFPATEEVRTTIPQDAKEASTSAERHPATERGGTASPRDVKEANTSAERHPATEKVGTARPRDVNKASTSAERHPATERGGTTSPRDVKEANTSAERHPATEKMGTARPRDVKEASTSAERHPATEKMSTARPWASFLLRALLRALRRPRDATEASTSAERHPATEKMGTASPRDVKEASTSAERHPATEKMGTTSPQYMKEASTSAERHPATEEMGTTSPRDVKEANTSAERQPTTEKMGMDRPQDVKEASEFSERQPATEKMGTAKPQDVKEVSTSERWPATEETGRTSPRDAKEVSTSSERQPATEEMGTARPQDVKESSTSERRPATEETGSTRPRDVKEARTPTERQPATEETKTTCPHALEMTLTENPPVEGATKVLREKCGDPGSPGLAKERALAGETPQKDSPLYRTEVWVTIGRGGETGSPVAAGKSPPFPLSKLQPPEVVVVPERGGSYKMRPEGPTWTFPCSEGSTWQQGQPSGRPSLPIHSPNVMPQQGWRIPGEAPVLRRRPRAPHPPLLANPPCVPSPGRDQLPLRQALSDPARAEAPAVNTSIETLFWEKDKILHQLDCSLQRMLPVSRPEIWHSICTPCKCHMETYQRDVAFSLEEHVWQRSQPQDSGPPLAREAKTTASVSSAEEGTQNSDLSSGESTTDVSLLGQEVSQEDLLRPSKLEVGHLLGTHVTQKALGSFVLPSCVICSHSRYKDMVTRQHRQKAREQREWLNSWFLKRKSHRAEFKDTRQGLSSPEHRADAKQQAPAVGHPGETKEAARMSPWEAPLGHSLHSPRSTRRSGASVDPQAHEGLQSSEEERESSGRKGSMVSGEPSLRQLSGSLDAEDELPAPPSDWIQSEVEEEGAERRPGSDTITAGNDAPWTPPSHPSERSPLPAEEWSQFTTECEEERVGDWSSGSEVCSSQDQAKEEGRRGQNTVSKAGRKDLKTVSKVGRRDPNMVSKAGRSDQKMVSLKIGSCLRPRREGASSSQGKEADQRVSIIASILDKKLWLEHGLHAWLDSQGGQGPGWRKRDRPRSSLVVDSTEGEKEFRKDPRGPAEPPVVECTMGRWVALSFGAETDGDAHRQAGTLAPGPQQFEAGRRGARLRPSMSTRLTCDDRLSLGKPSRLNLSQNLKRSMTMEGELTWDGHRRKSLRSAVGGQERWELHSHRAERGEGRAGSRKWTSSVRETGSCKREGPAISKDEETSSEAQMSSSKEWTPPGIRRRLLTKEWRLHRREKGSAVRVRFKDPCFSPVQRKKINLENRVILSSGHHQTSFRTSRHSDAFVASGHHPKMEAGRVAQGVFCADLRGQHPGHSDSTPTSPVCKPKEPLYGEHFHSLKEKILLRRRELGSSSESEEEKPA